MERYESITYHAEGGPARQALLDDIFRTVSFNEWLVYKHQKQTSSFIDEPHEWP